MKNQFILTPYFLDRYSAELEALAQPDWFVNRPTLPDGDNLHRTAAYLPQIANFVSQVTKQGQCPVSIAGDCCPAIGVIAGLQEAEINPTLLWLDAHGDFNTFDTSPSGFLGGMPLAMIVGRGDQTMLEAVNMMPFSESRIILCDGRDLDPGEKIALAASKIVHITDIHKLLDHPLLNNPIYLHLDTDVIDPTDAPGMSYLTPGGPSLADMKTVFRKLGETHNIIAVSMSTWNPDIDLDKRGQTVCMDLIQKLFL